MVHEEGSKWPAALGVRATSGAVPQVRQRCPVFDQVARNVQSPATPEFVAVSKIIVAGVTSRSSRGRFQPSGARRQAGQDAGFGKRLGEDMGLSSGTAADERQCERSTA